MGFAPTPPATPIFWGLHTCDAPQGSWEGWGIIKALPNSRGRCAAGRTERCKSQGQSPQDFKAGKNLKPARKKKKKRAGESWKGPFHPKPVLFSRVENLCSLRACSFKISLLFQQQISGGFLEKHQILPNSGI